MTVKAQILVPEVDVNVLLNSEVVLNIFDDGGLPLDPGTIDISVDAGGGPQLAISGGVFVNDWSGEIIDNSINFSDITAVIIRPVGDPLFPSGTKIAVHVEASIV